ncbi:kinase-like domain-containing protein, partial [Dichotomopilus funicola]
MAHKDTLFLLIPTNGEAEAALNLPANSRYVSSFSSLSPRGLEVGFHVTSVPSRVLATVGRKGDLTLQGSSVSRTHVAFEMHPDTLVVRLSVKAKGAKTVTVHRQIGAQPGVVEGDCVLTYGVEYGLTIAQYTFRVSWKPISPEALRDLAIAGYRDSRGRQNEVDLRDWPTEPPLQKRPWYEVRCDAPGITGPRFREAAGTLREKVGRGASASVYRAVDEESGHAFAIKAVARKTPAEALPISDRFKHEVNILSELKHENIIKLLGHAELPNGTIEIHLPLRPGNLRSIITSPNWRQEDDDKLCKSTMSQMLCALDYLAVYGLCHRDVKPENILCLPLPAGGHRFELADFELAVHISKAEGHCGTKTYQAPESHPSGKFPQSPKMDVWSLFATIADIHHRFDEFPPPSNASYSNVRRSIVAIAQVWPTFADMVQENPDLRVSAAELLLTNFDGEGLTT